MTEDRVEVVTLTEALQRLKDANKKDLYVRLEKYERGKYIIPMSFVPMIVGSQAQGKLYEYGTGGKVAKTTADLLAPQVLAPDVLGWTGTSGAVNGATRTSIGYRKLLFLFIQPTWTSAPTTMNYGLEFSEDGTTWFSSAPGSVIGITVGNGEHDWSVMYVEVAAGHAHPLGELGLYWRMVVTTVGGTANGDVQVLVIGVPE